MRPGKKSFRIEMPENIHFLVKNYSAVTRETMSQIVIRLLKCEIKKAAESGRFLKMEPEYGQVIGN